mmetsp:Transcript_20705/g.43926  ORF Transcript_20705/g.43926 Transcript_20705/m.43926 type:complete len:222 (-) Transcript_20705:37-702(-)
MGRAHYLALPQTGRSHRHGRLRPHGCLQLRQQLRLRHRHRQHRSVQQQPQQQQHPAAQSQALSLHQHGGQGGALAHGQHGATVPHSKPLWRCFQPRQQQQQPPPPPQRHQQRALANEREHQHQRQRHRHRPVLEIAQAIAQTEFHAHQAREVWHRHDAKAQEPKVPNRHQRSRSLNETKTIQKTKQYNTNQLQSSIQFSGDTPPSPYITSRHIIPYTSSYQ